jgi:hypothetical protein
MNSKLLYFEAFERATLDTSYWSLKSIQNLNKNIKPVNYMGRSCLSFTVFPGDVQMFGADGKRTERVEIREKGDVALPFSTHVLYSFEVAFPEDFRITNNRLVFAQWKHTNSRTNPPVSLRYRNNKLIVCIKNDTDGIILFPFEYDLRGKRSSLQVELKLTMTDQSRVKVTLDNKEIVDFTGKTSFVGEEPFSEFHMGIYRDGVDYSDTVYFSHFERKILS